MNIFRERLLKFFFSRRGLILSLFLYSLVLLIFFVQMFGKAYRKEGWDFSSYLLSSKAFFSSVNPYTTGSIYPFIYPLFVCIILFPLTTLPYWFACVVWFILSVLAIYYLAFLILRTFNHSLFLKYKHVATLILIPFFTMIDVIQNNLLNGQINTIVLLLCALFFKYCLESKKILSSLFLSGAISIKLTPMIFLIYLIIRKEFLLLGLTLLFSIFFLFGMPYALAQEKSIEWYSYYLQSFLIHHIAIQKSSTEFGFSITSILNYFFPSIPKLLAFLIAGLISILPIAWLQFIIQRNDAAKQTLIFSLYMISTLLISPISETHHLINLFPAVLLTTIILLFQYNNKNFQVGVFILLIVFISLFIRKFYFGISIVAVLALYGFILWRIISSDEVDKLLLQQ